MRRILCIGEQFGLLAIRGDLLRKTGAEITCVCADGALEALGKGRFDLLVICHTVRYETARRIASAARTSTRSPAVILLTPYVGAGPEADDPEFDRIAQAFPENLLHMAREMMGMKDEERRASP